MCSIASSLAGGGGHAYTSSKHALAGFTKQLALDYAEAGDSGIWACSRSSQDSYDRCGF